MGSVEKRRMCPNCRAFISTSDRVCTYCDAPLGPKRIQTRDAGDSLAGFIPHARFLTVMILTINIGLYLATALYSMRAGSPSLMDIDGRTLFEFGAKYRDAILLGQWWRLITAGFLHGGLFHILMNSWILFDLGAQVEEIYGQRRFIVIYFISTVAGFLASTFWSPALSIGASAGVFGLIGAMIALGLRSQTPLGSAIRALYIRWAIYGILIGLLPFFRVDNAAHIGGLIAGLGIGYFCGLPGAFETWTERLWKIAAGLCVLITGFAFLQMFLWFSIMNRG